MEVKVFDPNLRMSDQKMLQLIKDAKLQSKGYRVENSTKMVTERESDTPVFRKSVLYYKIVNCSQLQEVDQELQNSLPGKS